MKASRAQTALPLTVRRSLAKLGGDIAIARKRRRLGVAVVAERAFIGRNTVTRIERGDPGVALGIYATVLFVLGLSDRVGNIIVRGTDELGAALETERLPERIHTPGTRRPGSPAGDVP